MNKVILIGNLTADPELRQTSKEIAVCQFSLAVNRNHVGSDGERKTDFFNIVAWRGLGESVAKHVHKGDKVAVSGTIEINSYEDADGNKRTSFDIIAGEVEFLVLKSGHSNDDNDG